MARNSLFVLKVPLNPKQTNQRTCSIPVRYVHLI